MECLIKISISNKSTNHYSKKISSIISNPMVEQQFCIFIIMYKFCLKLQKLEIN